MSRILKNVHKSAARLHDAGYIDNTTMRKIDLLQMGDDGTVDEGIDLNQWVAEEQDRIKRFVAMWIKSRQTNPEHFPKKLPAGEWDEHFRAFESGE